MRTAITKMAGGALLLLVATLLIAPRAEAKSRFSGSAVANEIDVDDDGMTGDTLTFRSRGRFGNGLGQAHNELAPWDMMTFCGATSILLFYTVSTQVTTYANGDQLYQNLDNGTLCLNLEDSSFSFEIHLDVTGGTGKFQGATGSSTLTGSGQLLQGDPVPNGPDPGLPGRGAFSAFSGRTIDHIVLDGWAR